MPKKKDIFKLIRETKSLNDSQKESLAEIFLEIPEEWIELFVECLNKDDRPDFLKELKKVNQELARDCQRRGQLSEDILKTARESADDFVLEKIRRNN